MLASLLRPKKRRVYADRSPFSSPYTTRETSWPFCQDENRHPGPGAGYDEVRDARFADEAFEDADDAGEDADEDEEHRPIESTPLLPIFSASHLDALPVYDITHAIRPLIVSRCETTLTWDQLRSPQISQFLVKPIQQKIRALHFSRATLYALMANCLQFTKEIHLNPGNSGTSQTRAMVSELLAIKLLREYTTRELIDALSYEFHPLQGQMTPMGRDREGNLNKHSAYGNKRLAGAARISCLEVAIRTQAKRFLAHPVVVQQLEAIWAGTIVFHSAADSLHRSPVAARRDARLTYGSASHAFPEAVPLNGSPPRRSVTLYDPRDASLFKLSRLRVPRYRQFLSTLSFAVLLGLFLAVLQQRRVEISTLEVIFWFWSAGFMLDEIVGFNEQGFSLYLMSFWNLFDLGILFLLFCYYCMRLYGALMPAPYNRATADRAYDILAANAVLLFPRLFSVLDHYRYFSQLLIAFRIMASDLVAVFLLIAITCSGFFVAFTLSFGNVEEHSPASVAYALFQMLMGFTPAAWSLWDDYNLLGKTILTIFLFICHFVVMTILITVLTNSFMAIVQNANQEHQFLFAVNTISMVKSDALFSYVAPTNILAWVITPLRYLMPFRQFIRINRTIIKITHLPVLFTICLYEKTILSRRVIEPIDLVDPALHPDVSSRSRPRHNRFKAFSSRVPRLVREPSVATYQKDRALEEVFRHSLEQSRRPPRKARGQSNNIVSNWMQAMGSGPVHPPDEQDSDEVDRLERPPTFRPPFHERSTRSLRNITKSNRSATSDPQGQVGHIVSSPATLRRERFNMSPTRIRQLSRHTDIEGDDELTSEDTEFRRSDSSTSDRPEGISPGKATPKFYSSRPSTARMKSRMNSPSRRPRFHKRNYSAATMLYNPVESVSNDGGTEISSIPVRPRAETPAPDDDAAMATSVDQWTQRRHSLDVSNSRNVTLAKSNPMSVPDMGGFLATDSQYRGRRHVSHMFGLGSDLGDNKAIANGFLDVLPSSFTTQMVYAAGGLPRPGSSNSNQDLLSKLVLARMNNIEEGFREMLKEVKDLRRGESSRSQSRPDESRSNQREKKKRSETRDLKRTQESRKSSDSSKEMVSDGSSAKSRQ
ncbi:ion transporter [Aspergillus clavatus NRRL 1]|uniref:Cation channel family transporter, putative n=1 Tax=Aspergillus clavatus (strain ATCC 1007 / CBS 513.65 / DSM 816 / NCTC 3887 / NRRL 1 / QM 1276 / 107) TaxID=344612 RepID=A1CU15_ASPCL|nr:cation channel family transporter, putative [Aspergillus clavatus NRRL 1]EAW06802.1 cation channel family transporter, putative [Aspergillus clavatus NRRL 1]